MYQIPRRGKFRLAHNPRGIQIRQPVAALGFVLGFVHEKCHQSD